MQHKASFRQMNVLLLVGFENSQTQASESPTSCSKEISKRRIWDYKTFDSAGQVSSRHSTRLLLCVARIFSSSPGMPLVGTGSAALLDENMNSLLRSGSTAGILKTRNLSSRAARHFAKPIQYAVTALLWENLRHSFTGQYWC